MTAPVKTISELIAASEGHIFVHRVLGRPDLRKYVVKYLEEYYVVLSGSAYLFSGNDGSLLIPYENLKHVVMNLVNTGEMFEVGACRPQRYEEFDTGPLIQNYFFENISLYHQRAMEKLVEFNRRWIEFVQPVLFAPERITPTYFQYVQICLPELVRDLREMIKLAQAAKLV